MAGLTNSHKFECHKHNISLLRSEEHAEMRALQQGIPLGMQSLVSGILKAMEM